MTAVKHEWRKHEKELYCPKQQAVQILHVGPYDNEPESFVKVDEFCSAHSLQRVNDEWHREIYLSDARKVEPAKLKTVLRVQVKKG